MANDKFTQPLYWRVGESLGTPTVAYTVGINLSKSQLEPNLVSKS